MKNKYLLSFLIIFCFLAGEAFAQGAIVVNDPTKDEKSMTASAAEEDLIKRDVLPKARRLWAKDETCTEEFEIAGAAKGAFTKANAQQTLIFYQFCQTGNGFGHNGLVLIENGKVTASYASAGGWAIGLKTLPDINQNGLDEFAVYYSGGMHQGQGGTGVDVMEFSAAGAIIRGLGWFQGDMYGEETGDYGYKVTVNPGKTPVFYREKYMASSTGKWSRAGKAAAFKLGKAYGKFDVLK